MLTTLATIPIVAFLVLVLLSFFMLHQRSVRSAKARAQVADWKRQCLNDDRQLEVDAVEQTMKGVSIDRVIGQLTSRRAQLLPEGRPTEPANWTEDDLTRIGAERLAVADQAIRGQLVLRTGAGLVLIAGTTIVSMAVLYQNQAPVSEPSVAAGTTSAGSVAANTADPEFVSPPALTSDASPAADADLPADSTEPSLNESGVDKPAPQDSSPTDRHTFLPQFQLESST